MNVFSFLQNVAAEKVAYKTLLLIDNLFANDSMPTSWNNKLEDFQDIIYRQIEESGCVSETYVPVNVHTTHLKYLFLILQFISPDYEQKTIIPG